MILAYSDGRDSMFLATSRFGGIDPVWSPDGSKIMYGMFDEVAESDLEGTWFRFIESPSGKVVRFPRWSPEGSRMAFICFRPGQGFYTLYTGDMASEEVKLIDSTALNGYWVEE